MSRQSKNARILAKAREITRLHLAGEKGPARTVAKHGKRWGYRSNPEVAKRLADAMKAANEAQEQKTVLQKLNDQKSKVQA